MRPKNVSLAALAEAIEGAKHILISGHVRPDGDALGSILALTHVLNEAGKDATGVLDSLDGLGGPGLLEGIDTLKTSESVKRKTFDLFIAVDCASFERLPGGVQPLAERIERSVNIDHHFTNTRFATLNRVEGEASSTGEVLWRLIRHARWPMDRQAAEALWVALITDTGRFAYDSTGPATLRCASELLKYAVRTAYINDKLYCSFSPVSVELKRRAFATLTFTPDCSISSVTLTGKDFEETGGTKADAEDVIEIPRGLLGNRVAIFYYGAPGDAAETRISIRTRAPLDASVLAAKFGGGGHIRAAGCTIDKPLDEAKALFSAAIEEWIKEYE